MAYIEGIKDPSIVSVPEHTMDVVENRCVLKVELPGVEKADIDIRLKRNRLIIFGKLYTKHDKEAGEERIDDSNQTNMDENNSTQSLQNFYHLHFRIPRYVHGNQVEFKSYENGLLILNLPMHPDYMERKIFVV